MSESSDYTYLDLLNPQQREAVEYKDGPSLVIAGAGSGKTRVLTYKIVDLLRNGYEPYRILALTFTNKAAREMKERIISIVGEKVARKLWMGTFHSIFLRILRTHSDKIGFQSGFTIYDTADSRSLIKIIIKEFGLDEKIYKPASIMSAISNAKNAMISPEIYISDRDIYETDRRSKRPMLGQIYMQYCERCKRANAMDFDDILVYMNTLLRDNPDICRHYQEFFRYILVDEYQDTNFAQHLIISQISDGQKRLCVVGDDAQSIYSFRGADINNILNLEKRYPGLKIFKLERNYRSTQNIIDAAGSLITKNTRQMPKNVYSENEKGERINVVKTYSDMEEAFMVANLISRSQLTYHDSLEDYAVLYRTNAQSRMLEESLRKRNIAYRIYGGVSFYQRKEVKDMIAYFRLSVNPDDDEALRRIINYPARGIGETTLKKLQTFASEKKVSLWKALNDETISLAGFNKGTLGKLQRFVDLIKEFIKDNESGSNAFEVGQLIYNRTGVLTALAHDNTPESISRQENLSEILAGLKDFVDLREQAGEGDRDMRSFLSEVMLSTDQDSTDDDSLPKVTLMTVHAAKGLEFKHIFVAGVEEDLFPSSMSQDSLAQIEEERRLLYVAITRAKETCTLTYASSRFRNGQTVMTRPSRFLGDIDTRYLHMQMSNSMGLNEKPLFVDPTSSYNSFSSVRDDGGTLSKPGYEKAQLSQRGRLSKIGSESTVGSGITPLHTSSEVKIGTKIHHDRYGKGIITHISQISGEDTVTVDFGVVGIKKLLLKFAKFKIIE
ncbi:MAG: UvrD-helicase domain-containing protein [Muribaculaceae bacterium]|nr:UvrD-helicase domain-containing protein [Muribaculaceae bacterium]